MLCSQVQQGLLLDHNEKYHFSPVFDSGYHYFPLDLNESVPGNGARMEERVFRKNVIKKLCGDDVAKNNSYSSSVGDREQRVRSDHIV